MARKGKFEMGGGLGFGRGLGAVLGTEASMLETEGSTSFSEVLLAQISPNKEQPRKYFNEAALEDLASSIRQLGVVQPITVRKLGDDKYEIISGERRWRAAQKAGLVKVPAYIKKAEDEEAMQMAIVENLQREDLSAIELALGYKKLIDEQHLTQEKLSAIVGRKRATIANYLRLLNLPGEIQVGITDGRIDMAHARALLGLVNAEEQLDLYRRIVNEHLSARTVEQLVRDAQRKMVSAKSGEKQLLPEKYEVMRRSMEDRLGRSVSMIRSVKGKGKITITFNSDEELNAIYHAIGDVKEAR